MKSLFAAAALLLPVAVPAAGQNSPAQQEIATLEQRLNDALTHVDAKVISELWSDSFVFIAPNGKVSSKSERLAGLPPASSNSDALVSTIDEVSGQIVGPVAIAIVRTSWRGVAEGKSFSDPYIATHIWVKEGKTWRLRLAQVAQVATKVKNSGT